MNNPIEELETLLTKRPISDFYGICSNVSKETLKLILPLFKEWPLFSGDGSYPVPHPTLSCYSGYWQASDTGKMWVGEYGENRKALVKFLIERLRNEKCN